MTERSNIDEPTYLHESLPLAKEGIPVRPSLKVLDTTRLHAIDQEMDRLVDEMSEGHVGHARYQEITSRLETLRSEHMRLSYVPKPITGEFTLAEEESYAPLFSSSSPDQDPYPVPLPEVEVPDDGGKTLYDMTVGPRIQSNHENRPNSDKSLLANLRRRRA